MGGGRFGTVPGGAGEGTGSVCSLKQRMKSSGLLLSAQCSARAAPVMPSILPMHEMRIKREIRTGTSIGDCYANIAYNPRLRTGGYGV